MARKSNAIAELEALRAENEELIAENTAYQSRLAALKQLARAPIEIDEDEDDIAEEDEPEDDEE